jgi:hypothetical protein
MVSDPSSDNQAQLDESVEKRPAWPRHADGAACHAEALRLLEKFRWAPLALCPPDHVGIRLVNPDHARKCKKKSWGKAPFYPWHEFMERLPTAREINRWWLELSNSNVGIALGPVSGIVRVDVEGRAAEEQLLAVSGGDLPPTPEFSSGRGRGLLYAIPPGVVFKTTAQAFQDGELRFQAKGAQTVVPPSRHHSGRLYRWLPGRSPDEVAPAPAPRWAVERWQERPGAHRNPAPVARGSASTAPVNPAALFLALVALDRLSVKRASAYNPWLAVGMALHAVSPDLLDDWDAWSQRCRAKYEAGACAYKWASFGRRQGFYLGHLLEWARLDSGKGVWDV